MVKEAKKHMPITAELTPHHLYFNNSDIKGSSLLKMNPPLSDKTDMLALRLAFIKEEIDIISTDHAPHADHEKTNNWNESMNGIIGMETSFAAVNTVFECQEIEKVLRAMTINPAKLINKDVEIKHGKKADLVILDPLKEWTVTLDDIRSKSSNNPWIGHTLKGKVEKVIIGENEYE